MLPLLELAAASDEVTTAEYYPALAARFELTDADRAMLIPSGRALVYKNRIAWAVTHLVKAGLLERPSRGTIRITGTGHRVLAGAPSRVDLAFLERFSGSRQFRGLDALLVPPHPAPPDVGAEALGTASMPPDEQLGDSYQRLRESLALDLLDRIKASPPAFFEQLVVDLLVAMGYGGSRSDAGKAIGGSGDGGIDGIIKEDRLGLDFVYIQAKRWEGVVGRPQIQGFAGSLEGQRARKGVFITTSAFTEGARQYVGNIEKRIVLIDGQQLAELMLDYGIGVTEVATYKVQRVDLDYFGEE